jgi:hypothetical protein
MEQAAAREEQDPGQDHPKDRAQAALPLINFFAFHQRLASTLKADHGAFNVLFSNPAFARDSIKSSALNFSGWTRTVTSFVGKLTVTFFTPSMLIRAARTRGGQDWGQLIPGT